MGDDHAASVRPDIAPIVRTVLSRSLTARGTLREDTHTLLSSSYTAQLERLGSTAAPRIVPV